MNNKMNSIKDLIVNYKYVLIAITMILMISFGALFIVNKSIDANIDSLSITTKSEIDRVSTWKPDSYKSELFTKTLIPIRKESFSELNLPNAHSAVIIDVESENILYKKNATEHRGIASTTKLLTAMIVIDRVKNLDEYVTIPKEVLNIEGTKIGCITSVICRYEKLKAGEKVKVRDLLYAMLMNSANDAATVLGIYISGSERQFAELMNLRVKELRLGDSNFCRASGLEVDPPRKEEECYSSAYDIGRVMVHLLKDDKYDEIWRIMKTKELEIKSKDGKITHKLENTNKLLKENPHILGAKTGFTPRAGYSLVIAGRSLNKKHKVVAVVLDDKDRFLDGKKMIKWAFENYNWH